MTQSRRMSMIEAITNVAVGYALAVVTQILVFPWFGLHPSLGENLAIGALFTSISLLRSYALRRLFEVVSRMLWKFPGGALRACEGSVFQAARSRGIGSMG